MYCKFRFTQAEQKLDPTLETTNTVSIAVGLTAECEGYTAFSVIDVPITPRSQLTKNELRNFVMKAAIENNLFNYLRDELSKLSGNLYINNSFQSSISFDVLDTIDGQITQQSLNVNEMKMQLEENIKDGEKNEEFSIQSNETINSVNEEEKVSIDTVELPQVRSKKKKK